MRVRAWSAALATSAVVGASLASGGEATSLFEDATKDAGLAGVHGARISFADLNGDGAPDLIVDCAHVFLNEKGRFVRAGRLVPEGARAPACAQVGDVNGDGKADVYLGRSTDLSKADAKDDGLRSEILLGDGKGGFTRKENSGVGDHAETTVSACFVDYDSDGVLDLYVGNQYVAYGKSLEAFPSRLYRGKGDGTFEDVTEKAGLLLVKEPGRKDSRRPTYGVAHADWDDDGRQDLLQLSYGRQWNRLWHNKGDGTFEDVGSAATFDGDADRSGKYSDEIKKKLGTQDEQPFRANGNTFDSAVADYDGDGDLDVFLAEITHWWAGPSSDLSMLLVNEGAANAHRFTRHPELIARKHDGDRWNQGDLHAGWLDVDGDGLLDLAIASSDYPDDQLFRVWRQTPDHLFEERTEHLGFRWRNACQVSFADFDGDGTTDVALATNNMRLTPEQVKAHSLDVGLFRNVGARGAKSFVLRLAGKGAGHANRDAIGAKVSIWAGGRRQTRIVQGGLGHAGHRDDLDARFSLGAATKVDRVEVRWPDRAGTVQTFGDVAPGLFFLVEGGELRPGRHASRWY